MPEKPKVYLGLTTTQNYHLPWQDKVKEIKALGIKEICVFLTGLNLKERQELYALLEQTDLEHVPFVHLRHDSTIEEIEYFKSHYKTQLFNIHISPESLPFYLSIADRKKIIFAENIGKLSDVFFDNLDEFAGVCLDIAHMEDFGLRQKKQGYDKFLKMLNKIKIGFAHISAVNDKKTFAFGKWDYSAHLFEELNSFDYLKKYRSLLPEILGLEIENTLAEQLIAKDYIEKNIL